MANKTKKAGRPTPHEDALFRLAVEAAPNAMIVVAGDGRIVLVNSQTEKVFGYKRTELIGRTMEILVPPRFRAGHPAQRARFFSDPQTRAMGAGRELFGLRKDGSEVPVEIGLNPIAGPKGRFVLASIVDITERRALEKKLAHTEVLASIGQMVAVVAHEIRNPLGSIIMAAKSLAAGGLSQEDLDQVMSVLVNESQRLNGSLGDFLQFARPREPRLETGDLNAATREILAAAKSDRNVVGQTVIWEALDERIPPIAFDPGQIRQVLWNIIRNAFQALDGKGRLEIKTEARAGKVAVHVRDSGPGIDPDRLEKIFMPFFTTKAKGTGLGLSLSRNIVLAHGGDIQVESRPGKGTRFSVILPAKISPG